MTKILTVTVEIPFESPDDEELTNEDVLYQFDNYTDFYLRSSRVVGEPTVREG